MGEFGPRTDTPGREAVGDQAAVVQPGRTPGLRRKLWIPQRREDLLQRPIVERATRKETIGAAVPAARMRTMRIT